MKILFFRNIETKGFEDNKIVKASKNIWKLLTGSFKIIYLKKLNENSNISPKPFIINSNCLPIPSFIIF